MKYFTLALNGKSQNVSVNRLKVAFLAIIASDSLCESIPIQHATFSQKKNVITGNNVHVQNVSNTSSETESQTSKYLTETDIIYNYDQLRRQQLPHALKD